MNLDAVGIVYFFITCVWTLFVISSAFLFIKNRNYPSIKYRSVPLFCVNAISNLLVTVNILLSAPLSSKYSCLTYFWVLYLCLPLWIITTLVKHIRLIILYRFGAERILFAYSLESPILGKEMLDSNNAHINATTEVLNRRMFPKGGWLRRLLTPQAHIIGIAVWMLPHIVLAIALHYALLKTQKDYDLTIVVAHCIDGWYWTPVLGIFIVYTVGVLPIIFYYLRGIKDAYDMRLEVLWDICIGAISTIASLLSTELDNNESISKVFPNQMWTALMCICMYFISVVIPFREKRRFQALHPSKNGSFPVFEDILNNYSLFREFHAFSVRDFSVENPSFYHRANQWRIDMKRIEGTAYSPLRTKLHAEAHEIYETFISNHADFEINIKGETSQRIYFDISQTMIESTVFDRALLEVVDMMYQQTFPRFLRYKGWVNGNGY